jgi:GH35 family endo-1,4-beta-xylanase
LVALPQRRRFEAASGQKPTPSPASDDRSRSGILDTEDGRMNRIASTATLCVLLASNAWAINGSDLALNSGSVDATAAVLDDNGYVGTYVTLTEPGQVTITVNARGTADGGGNPHMNVVVDDGRMGWDVGATSSDYGFTLKLPAGTHFIRTEFNNDRGTARSLAINSLDVAGATISNVNSNANALAAADTYTENFRKGAAKLALVGVAPGTQVHAKLKRHEFNFGTTVPNSFTDTLLVNNPAPGSDAARFQQALVDNRFNSLSAENGAKWDANEGTRDVLTSNAVNPNGGPNIPYMDRISDFAAAHGMGYRQHNLIWGPNNQQPAWVVSMLNNPDGTDTYNPSSNPQGTNLSNRDALFSDQVAPAGTPNAGEPSEIHERIKYYVGDRAQRFYQVDVYNESYHTGSNAPGSNNYWDLYGASGVAKIYKLADDAIAAAGSNAQTFVNEYSVLENQGGDYYANWYLRHIESIQNAGQADYGQNVVGGIGFQYYDGGTGNHNPARIYADMQNLSVEGLPLALTEWGVRGTDSAANEANAAITLDETTRLVFGTAGTTGITLWNLRNVPGVFAPVGTLYDNNWTPRDTAVAWQSLMHEWDTDVTVPVNPDGTIGFTGFYGDYEVTIGNQTYALQISKGDALYSLVVAPGDYNADGVVDAADYTVWRDSLGSTDNLRADGNGDEQIDQQDYVVWKSHFGTNYGTGAASSTPVPEPIAGVLLGWGVLIWCLCQRPQLRLHRPT